MTEPNTAGGVVTPPATDTSVQNPPPATETKVEGDKGLSGEALNQRIAQAKRSAEADARAALLKELGVDTLDTAKARVATAKKLEDDAKSELEKRDARIKELETTAAKVAPLQQAVNERAAAELEGLANDAHREMVKAIAGDDPASQLSTIAKLRKGGAFAIPVTNTAGKAPIPPPANTSAAGAAPPPANPNAPNHKATLESLEKVNPMAAAHYALRNQGEIYKGDGGS